MLGESCTLAEASQLTVGKPLQITLCECAEQSGRCARPRLRTRRPSCCSISASSLGTREIIGAIYPASQFSPISQFAETRKNEIRMM